MSFNSLNQLLKLIEKQPGWEVYRQHRQLLECWDKVVEPKIANQTRPLYIARKVLWVATSSSTWANHLSFQRYPLLKKLNALLSEPLDDIRFSPADWYKKRLASDFQNPSTDSSIEAHPSFILAHNPPMADFPEPKNPQEAFQRWVEWWKRRSQNLPLCPQCEAPTPSGELERWGVCAYCMSQKWNSNSQLH